MLVDDDPTMRVLLQTLFEIEGFTVDARSSISVEEILGLKFETPPGLLLMDVHLGSTNSISLVAHVRKSGCSAKDIRIILTSGMDLRIESAEAGADGFLLKPYIPDDLFRLIRALDTNPPIK